MCGLCVSVLGGTREGVKKEKLCYKTTQRCHTGQVRVKPATGTM